MIIQYWTAEEFVNENIDDFWKLTNKAIKFTKKCISEYWYKISVERRTKSYENDALKKIKKYQINLFQNRNLTIIWKKSII